ncbi:MAG: FADH(2)-oxidizing methylenetetrahydrofolate--tRNA-(uracil(54)-C(5))-methyltransferase TrmFO [Loigolactobacillus coryniformis]|jgi:methylenetetrahydrofolate--tRNA-(uracil-5-)-methyltransferase|uniref:Methylenetetrahydrofolate--tRNA-(uracil-5-)-methyltransferase TrmFO n=2 Tax=Loigolactobacillus coryniformis subsp. coryniformis TaxID=115541 RepID=J3JBQ8_9LACO|nr:FADH(2)-oxidizing methylenetetrahydrofolate--tRNA-(uracil(54)-C(5))-methyltransferase TrmFO [Loigolactobacillus coryniformis]OEH89328.1 tRNA (uracil-5-)-methyltransferase [Loigolactobacillus coryniformis subsp. coryniformis]ATO55503.1 methylenetetrahydrofolate--tRNA-(uracil(54)-C(5))-methyltransferase (FADH(2)-oxidizing) TrmFO [Loigolactobacillus coryniformis subsp. coryniformis KCTC 3167 = DSM 20001]EJN55937.1 Methylenetetrahydrofolate--tRNA-(uracil-5-)-methyltransferase TrmFO [Loigolactobac
MTQNVPHINVIGAGLAGSEAAWQAAQRGVHVDLYEMRPVKTTPAHHTAQFAELVCTNSLRANQITNAVGLLKEEMRQLNSVILAAADQNAVPAGGALAVDREPFSASVTERIKSLPNVTVHNEELTAFPEGPTVVATGPLTSPELAKQIQALNDSDGLYFYDAAAPILDKNSIDFDKVYLKSRYDKGEAAYLNCPMDKQEFETFYKALITAETAEMHGFEDEKFFEGCMPIEVMAKRGLKTMLFGPLKPVGLEDPRTGKQPYAVIQLRQDNAAGSLYNIVGFQTHLKWGEQKRVFRLIPGLENAEFVRYGVMHRNTFMRSPELLEPTYQSKKRADLFFAGQMTGVEGYVESAASGLVAGLNAARLAQEQAPVVFPQETAIGAMAHYITHTSAKHFQPMNANFGIVKALPQKIRDKQLRNQTLAERSLATLAEFKQQL